MGIVFHEINYFEFYSQENLIFTNHYIFMKVRYRCLAFRLEFENFMINYLLDKWVSCKYHFYRKSAINL